MKIKFIIILLFLPGYLFSQSSILSTGDWIKIGVTKSGIYKLDKNFFQDNNVEYNLINPSTIQIFGSGYNGLLPQKNNLSTLFSPKQLKISFYGNNNDVFEDNEFVYFYAQSSDKLVYDTLNNKMQYDTNIYTDSSFFLLTYNQSPGNRVDEIDNGIRYDSLSDEVFHFSYFEEDIYSIIQSGRDWFGSVYTHNEIKSFDILNYVPSSDLNIELQFLSRSLSDSKFSISINDEFIDDIELQKITEGVYGNKGLLTSKNLHYKVGGNNPSKMQISYSGSNTSLAYLDYFTMSGKIKLFYQNDQLKYFTRPSTLKSFVKFKIESNSEVSIWNVTDLYNIHSYKIVNESDNLFYISNIKNYTSNIIFSLDYLLIPAFSYKISNSNIINHSNPDLIIITNKLFYDYANMIKTLREKKDNLVVDVVLVDDIYNQFSSANPDVSSIRNFIKYVYNTSSENLKYVLLFGDCSYDFKDRIPNNTNFIPIYQSYNSINNIYSFSSDDYYGFLDDDEGEWIESIDGDHYLDVGVGRIPIKTRDEASAYVEKLVKYSDKKNLKGDWKNDIYLVADDGDNNVHQNDAESHFNLLNNNNKSFNINKIYLDFYEQKLIDGIKTSPKTKVLLDEAIDRGSLILNYVGHGNEFLWAEEKILNENSIYSWNNRMKLPLFITATCEFGKFDDPLITSGGEMLLNKSNGGAIALLTTTRPVFSKTNFRLNNQFYKYVFKKQDGEYQRLGDIFKNTKNNSLSGSINRNFALLGDPSMKLAYPSYTVNTEAIDTLKALGKVIIKGQINDYNENIIDDFNGDLFVDVFDKIVSKQTLGDESDPFTFYEWENKIFRGFVEVKNGNFSFEFVVPKNIEYKYGIGRMIFFATDTTSFLDASSSNDFIIGGTSDDFDDDTTPPTIDIFLDSYDFISGNSVSKDPLLIVDLFDLNGINITEINSFHTMRAIVDDTIEIKLNDYFITSKNEYKQGVIRYPLNGLEIGKHKIEIKVSDTYNNLSSKSVVFVIDNNNLFNLYNLMNYPNPFSYETTFSFDHDSGEQPLFIHLEVFDLIGTKLYHYEEILEYSNSHVDGIIWNGNDMNNNILPQGIYIYKLHVKNLYDNSSITTFNKIIKTY